MKKLLSFLWIVLALSFSLSAGESRKDSDISASKAADAVEEKKCISLAQEFNSQAGFTAGAETHNGGQGFGHVSELNDKMHYVISPEVTPTFLPRIGVEWERFSYSLPRTNIPIPNTLQETSAIIGFDLSLSDKWLFRFEAQPGVYGDYYRVNSNYINVPMILGASYLVNENLQWVFGASIDTWRYIPVIPGAGVRWQFAPNWVLDFILPKPRLEYNLNERTTFYVGAEIKGGTYRLGSDVANRVGQPGLNGAIVEYTESRAGGGFSWECCHGFKLEGEAGAMVERSFDYHRFGSRVGSDATPYGQLALNFSL